MLQMSKILNSRNEWKSKAVRRAEENQELRKTRKRHQEKIAELKMLINKLEQGITSKKTPK